MLQLYENDRPDRMAPEIFRRRYLPGGSSDRRALTPVPHAYAYAAQSLMWSIRHQIGGKHDVLLAYEITLYIYMTVIYGEECVVCLVMMDGCYATER